MLCSTLFFAASSLSFALLPDRDIAQYGHRSWRIQDGFLGGQPHAVAQTKDGYIWVGTAAGLSRFDGVRFEQISLPGTAESSPWNVFSLLGTRDGALWIGSDKGIARYRGGEIVSFPSIRGHVSSIVEDPVGGVWFARGLKPAFDKSGPLCHALSSSVTCYGKESGIGPEEIDRLARAANGRLWLGSSTQVEEWDKHEHQAFEVPGLQANRGMQGVLALLPTSDGGLWVGSSPNGPKPSLFRLTKPGLAPFRLQHLGASGQQISSGCLDNAGSLWIGTVDQGVFRLAQGRVDHFSRLNGLSGDLILQLFEDREGTLWVVTSKGLDCFFDTSVVTFSRAQGLASDEIDAVTSSVDGIWFTTPRGVSSWPRKDFRPNEETRFGGQQATSVYDDKQGHVWAGVGDDLLIRETGHVHRVTSAAGKSLGLVDTIAKGEHGTVWVEIGAPERRLVHASRTSVIQSFSSNEVPAAIPITEDLASGLWLGSRKGTLVHFDGKAWKEYPFPHASSDRIRQIILETDGTVLSATTFGLLSLQNGKEQLLDEHHGLPCRDMHGVVADSDGNIWLSSECGIFRISTGDLHRWLLGTTPMVSVDRYLSAEGIQPLNAIYGPTARSADHKLWFANANELQMIDPAHLVTQRLPAAPLIEGVQVDLKRINPTPQSPIPARPREIEIDYTSPTFTRPQDVLFRYKLQGHDTQWTDAGRRRQAYYNDLQPGTYTFAVMVGDAAGHWNQAVAMVQFQIAPALYQTIWFRTLASVAGLACLWALYAFRIRRATALANSHLEERLRERERIARELHDTLLQGFQGLLLQFHVVRQKLTLDEAAGLSFERIMKQGEDLLVEARTKVRDLRINRAPRDSLSERLIERGNALALDHFTPFRSELQGQPITLHDSCNEEIYEVVQEALTNAFRHAGAEQVTLYISFAQRGLTIRISDDGRGIDQAILRARMRPGHFGLVGMQERATAIGAELSFVRPPGGGTLVQLFLHAARFHTSSDRAGT